MELSVYFKSIIDSDTAPIVICSNDDEIVYMNPAAVKRYAKRGGEKLVGSSLSACHNEKSNRMIAMVKQWFSESPDNNRMFTFHNQKENKDVYMIALRDLDGTLIGYYEKHEYRTSETTVPYEGL